MSAINNSTHLYNEIQYNLDIMQTSLNEGKSIDFGFIEIFASDIKELESAKFEQKQLTKLNRRLNELATRIYDKVGESILKPVLADEVRPLVGNKENPSKLAKTHAEGEVKKGLEALSKHFLLQPIAQDGHCLFRSTATLLIEQIRKSNSADQQAIYAHVAAQIEALKNEDKELEPLYQEVLQLVTLLAQEKKTIKEALTSRDSSDLLVKFLRHLACAYNKKHGNEVFESAASLEGSKETYLTQMRDMQKATWGDQPEINALSQTLGLDLRAIDLQQLGKGTLKLDSYLADAKANTVYVVLRPGHYDVALPGQ